jgi:hypothetical protein
MILYEQLENLGDQVLYCDTDSILYVYDSENKQHKKIETGPDLGQWKDELADSKGENWIVKFMAAGPKNYSYRLHRPNGKGVQDIVKVKGFTLTKAKTSDTINAAAMEELVKEFATESGLEVDNRYSGKKRKRVSEEQFVKVKKRRTIETREVVKSWGVIFDKVEIQQDFSTLPFGHQDCRWSCPHHSVAEIVPATIETVPMS